MFPFDSKYQPRSRAVFANYQRFRNSHISKFDTLKMLGQGHNVQESQWRIRWQISDFQFDGNSNVYIFQLLPVKRLNLKV